MTVNLQDGSAGLFDVLGKVFFAMDTADTAVGTTVHTEVTDILSQFENVADDLVLNAIVAQAATAQGSFVRSGETLLRTLRQLAREYVIEIVDSDIGGLTNRNYVAAIEEIRQQMLTAAETCDASAVAVSIASSPAGADKGVLVVTEKRGDGLDQSHILAETIDLTDTLGTGSTLVASSGPRKETLDVDWPGKSGTAVNLTVAAPSNGIIRHGNFDTLNTDDTLGKGAIAVVGTPGTSVRMTTPEQQTLTVSGSPDGGSYHISWSNADSVVQTTDLIAFSGSAGSVQAALRNLSGLERVTVTATGTSPNFTHTVTFIGHGGNAAQFTILNHLTGGTSPAVTPATSVAGTAQVYTGTYAMEFASDGSELTEVVYRLSGLEPETCYALNTFLTLSSAAAYSVSTYSFVDSFSISAQTNTASDLYFKSDGLKYFVLDAGVDLVYQYTMSVAWDITTSSYDSKSMDVSGEDDGGNGLYLSDDGTKAYMTGFSTDAVYQYTLSTPWDISTGSYASKSMDVSSEETSPGAVVLGDSGTKAYVCGQDNDTVYQYTLSTAWDISTGSYASKSKSVSSETASANGLHLSPDGTKMFVASATTTFIFEYDLSTAWDVSTASYNSVSLDHSSEFSAGAVSVFIGDSGSKLYSNQQTSDKIWQYSIGAIPGAIQFALLDGIGGSVIDDAQGTANSHTVNAASLTASWLALAQDLVAQPVFRTPETIPDVVYLTIRFTTATPDTNSVFFDQLTLIEMTELYAGGPFASVFAGLKPFVIDDAFAITVTNDRAGLLHEWLARTFDLATQRLLLPVDGAGAETVPDTVIS